MSIEFIRYNNWANTILLEACSGLNAEQMAVSIPGTFGTIHATLVHIVRAEASYALRLSGTAPEPSFKWEDNPGPAELMIYARQVGDALIEAASHIEPHAIIHQQWQGQTTAYRAITLLIQIVNHGIEHRTHVTTILSQIGVMPPDIDGWSYMWANRDRLGESALTN